MALPRTRRGGDGLGRQLAVHVFRIAHDKRYRAVIHTFMGMTLNGHTTMAVKPEIAGSTGIGPLGAFFPLVHS